MLAELRYLLLRPIRSPKHWGLIGMVALLFILAPQFDYNDWERNTDGLSKGANLYAENENAVYPPWGLILLWPYYFLTSAGARVASTLTVGWLAARQKWSVAQFLTIVLSPFYLWTMTLTNIDILALLLPIILWEAAGGKHWQTLGRSAALALLLIKPQGALFVIAFWLWRHRREWRGLVIPFGVMALLVVPISLIGSPPLILQWLDNVRHPSEENAYFWSINNISLTEQVGLIAAIFILALLGAGIYGLMRWRGKAWRLNHTYACLLLASMFLSVYTSNQSVIAALAFLPSLPALIAQYGIILGLNALLGDYRDVDTWGTLAITLIALWCYRPRDLKELK